MSTIVFKSLSKEKATVLSKDATTIELSEEAINNILLAEIHNRLAEITNAMYAQYKAPTIDLYAYGENVSYIIEEH